MADNYQDLTIKRQVLLERLKSGQFRDFNEAIEEMDSLIREAFVGLNDELGEMSRTKVEKFIREVKKDQTTVLVDAIDDFVVGLSGVAQLTAEQEYNALEKFIDLSGTKLAKFTKIDLQKAVLKRPLSINGQLLDQWTKTFTKNETDRVGDVIRLAWAEGETNQQAVRRIAGTKANGFKDGVLNTTRRHASTLVRTSVQHVASSARMEIWQKNDKIVRGYEWLSTLDRKTSSQCKSLDGRKFEFGKGPVPPIHPNCRSTTLPLTNPKFDFLDEGATRSAEFGPVKSDATYFDWLNIQDRQTVIDALGPKRAKLFLDGGLTAKRFRDLQFDRNFEPLTLAQMEKKEPAAFKKAFGTSPPVPPRKRDKSQKKTTKPRNQSPQQIKEKREKMVQLEEKVLEKERYLEDLKKERNESGDFYRLRELRQLIREADEDLFHTRRRVTKEAHGVFGLPPNLVGSKESMVNRQGIDQDVKDLKTPKSSFRYLGEDLREPIDKMEDALTWLAQMVNPEKRPKNVGVRKLPDGDNRAYYNDYTKAIYIDEYTSEATFIHEFVHDIEFTNESVSNKTKAYLLKRSEGEKAEKLSVLTGVKSYKDHEIAFEDKWVERGGSVYTGKVYSDQATEVLTMGTQRLFEDPIQFAKEDPDFFDFIIDTLQNQ